MQEEHCRQKGMQCPEPLSNSSDLCIKFGLDQWGQSCVVAHVPLSHLSPSVTCHFMELGVSRGKSSSEPRKRRADPLRAGREASTGMWPRGGKGRRALAVWSAGDRRTPALMGTAGGAGPSAPRRRAALNITPEFSIISS